MMTTSNDNHVDVDDDDDDVDYAFAIYAICFASFFAFLAFGPSLSLSVQFVRCS